MGADILRLDPTDSNKIDPDKPVNYFNLTYEDLLYIKRRCKFIKAIAMLSSGDLGGSSWPVGVLGKKYSRIEPIGGMFLGTLPDYQKIKNLKVIKGRFINRLDLKLKRRVCVLGNTTYIFLREKNIIGKKIKVALSPEDMAYYERNKRDSFPLPKEPFTVIGVLARENPFALPIFSQEWWCDDNQGIFIPYTVVSEVLEPSDPKYKGFLGEVFIKIAIKKDKALEKGIKYKRITSEKEFKEWQEKIKRGKWVYDEKEGLNVHKSVEKEAYEIINVLKERYGKDKKFCISSAGRLLDELESQTKQANTFIATIGIISLIVSIISILSMMLLSVHHRTSEIGVRRAFGARKKDIFFQFLKEAMVISGTGGIIGIVFGIIGANLIGWYASWEMVIPWYSIVLALASSFIIAIIGGTYPAYRASCIPPARAVKYE